MNNSQLIKTLAKKRTANFREDETRLLISLWGSPQIQNKLNLTHRKAPVMRLIAANMQQRGFYRSPDEIKTRIRNLKCLYHRIKRTITSGSGIGTVDPDWPHFKAMDAILGESSNSSSKMANGGNDGDSPMNDSSFEIKQEIDINDDMESWAGNDSVGSEYDDDLTPASLPEPAITITTASNQSPINTPSHNNNGSSNNCNNGSNILNLQANSLMSQHRTVACTSTPIRPQGPSLSLPPSIPLPFLILNSLKPAPNSNQNQPILHQINDGAPPNKKKKDIPDEIGIGNSLHELIEIQKQQLDIERQRLEIEKQRLEFDRLVGSQLMTLVPMMGSLVQRLVFPQQNANLVLNKPYDQHSTPENGENQTPSEPNTTSELAPDNGEEQDELEKNRNILRNLLNQGLKARMLAEQNKQNREADPEPESSVKGVVTPDQSTNNDVEIIDDEEKSPRKSNRKKKVQEDSQENSDDDSVTEINVNEDSESCVLLINENSTETNEDN